MVFGTHGIVGKLFAPPEFILAVALGAAGRIAKVVFPFTFFALAVGLSPRNS